MHRKSSAPSAHPPADQGEYRSCFICRGDGVVYIGRALYVEELGEEVDAQEAHRCKTCGGTGRTKRI